MGLIKTAMMTGAGIYAMKQLAKTAERRCDNPSRSEKNNNSQGSRENGHPSQYWDPPPPRTYPCGACATGDYSDQRQSYDQQDYQYQQRERSAGQPPSYYQQAHYATGRQDQNDNSGRGQSGIDGLAGAALEFAGSGNGPGKNDKKHDKSTQMASEFFGK